MAAAVASAPKPEAAPEKPQAAAQQQQDVWEEDAFEEFENDDWAIVNHEDNQELWQADWDDDDVVVDDFATRLKDELDKTMKE